jgi:hypothetical protein
LYQRFEELGWNDKHALDGNEKEMLVREDIERSIGCLAVSARKLKTRIFIRSGHTISRKFIEMIMKAADPEGFILRTPGYTIKPKRAPMFGVGPNAQWSADGHDKLAQFNVKIMGLLITGPDSHLN